MPILAALVGFVGRRPLADEFELIQLVIRVDFPLVILQEVHAGQLISVGASPAVESVLLLWQLLGPRGAWLELRIF
jgi:hypothetical protein